MTTRLQTLKSALEAALGDKIAALVEARGELTLTVKAADYAAVALQLRDDASLQFEQLIDLCGLDYADYRNEPRDGPRFCVVSHLLSVAKNWRVRLKVFCPDDDLPSVASVTGVWSAANWFEREAFDLFGIIF
jgi:NADH-quinone oxidoreductase subunit C